MKSRNKEMTDIVSFSLGGIDLFTGVKRSYHPREKIVSQR